MDESQVKAGRGSAPYICRVSSPSQVDKRPGLGRRVEKGRGWRGGGRGRGRGRGRVRESCQLH